MLSLTGFTSERLNFCDIYCWYENDYSLSACSLSNLCDIIVLDGIHLFAFACFYDVLF